MVTGDGAPETVHIGARIRRGTRAALMELHRESYPRHGRSFAQWLDHELETKVVNVLRRRSKKGPA